MQSLKHLDMSMNYCSEKDKRTTVGLARLSGRKMDSNLDHYEGVKMSGKKEKKKERKSNFCQLSIDQNHLSTLVLIPNLNGKIFCNYQFNV